MSVTPSSSPPDAAAGSRWLQDAFARYERPLVTYAARIVQDADRARDVVQDVFLRLCRQPREKVQPILAQWLFTVCRNRALDVCKKENRMTQLGDRPTTDSASREPDQAKALEQREQAESAVAMLDDLPENQREVIRLKLKNDLSYRQISEITGHSVSNVGYLLHMGFKALRSRLEQSLDAT